MHFRACIALLLQGAACATSTPDLEEPLERDPRRVNLQRAAALPWTDGGQCVVQALSEPWPVLAERCYYALDHDRVEFHDTTGRCSVASAGAAAVGLGICVLAAPEIVVGAVVVTGVVVVGFALRAAMNTYALSRGLPETRPLPETMPAPRKPSPEKRPKPEPTGQEWLPPLPPDSLARERHRRCEGIPVKHRGGDDAHNTCADRVPPNRYPGMDVLVDGKRFDALQVGVRVLWEIKTDQFDTYSDFLQKQVVRDQLKEMREERDIAEACGYGFVVGVSTEEHKEALEAQERRLTIIVTGCER